MNLSRESRLARGHLSAKEDQFRSGTHSCLVHLTGLITCGRQQNDPTRDITRPLAGEAEWLA